MIIDPIVIKYAKKYYIDPNFLQSIVNAEKNLIKAVQCSYPEVKTLDEAFDITCHSIIHRLTEFNFKNLFQDKMLSKEFVEYFGSFWAPIGVKNDPKNLNKNWVPNVLKLWGKL